MIGEIVLDDLGDNDLTSIHELVDGLEELRESADSRAERKKVDE